MVFPASLWMARAINKLSSEMLCKHCWCFCELSGCRISKLNPVDVKTLEHWKEMSKVSEYSCFVACNHESDVQLILCALHMLVFVLLREFAWIWGNGYILSRDRGGLCLVKISILHFRSTQSKSMSEMVAESSFSEHTHSRLLEVSKVSDDRGLRKMTSPDIQEFTVCVCVCPVRLGGSAEFSIHLVHWHTRY